jgi:hypothetical protein
MPSVSDINVEVDSVTLVVAWRAGHIAACRVVKAGGEVVEHLRNYAKHSLDQIRTGEGRPYNPDSAQEAEDAYLSANQEELLDTALLAQIKQGASLPSVTPAELTRKRLALYAILVGNDPNANLIFIHRGNPVKLASKMVAIFDRTLTHVTDPILAFEDNFDVVLYANEAWIFNQSHFEALFKESDAVLAQTAKWAKDLAAVLPIAEGGTAYLADRLRLNSVMRRKVQSILRSDYLPRLTPDTLVKSMITHGLDPGKLMTNDELIFSKDTERDVLLLLNEDLWTGDFSGEQYAAARKDRI